MKLYSDKYRSLFPASSHGIWEEIIKNIEYVTEIRIRAGKPILVYLNRKELSIDENGRFIYLPERGRIFSCQELQNLLNFWCQDSRYAFQNEIKRGFLTIEGGHRIGICGEVISNEEKKVQAIKYISAVNIRIAHEIKGVANHILKYIYLEETVKNTLIVSPPGAGKTTLLRDIIRQLSNGNSEYQGINIGLVDERGEIAACFQGIPQLDVGIRTDVLDNCEKITGMRMLLRAMSPAMIAVDELGGAEEIELIKQMVGNGCGIIATIHGKNIEDLKRKKFMNELWEQKIFENIVCLSRNKNLFQLELYQGDLKKICYKY